MTDEKFEQILKTALVPDVLESDVVVKKRGNRGGMRRIKKTVLTAAACAALAVGGPTTGYFLKHEVENAITTDTPFVINVMAAELEQGGVVYLDQSAWDAGWGFGYLEDTGEVSYSFLLMLDCVGDNIESVTYGVNEGVFCVTEPRDKSIMIDSDVYNGTFQGVTCGGLMSDEENEVQHLVTEYTVSYEQQTAKDVSVSLCGSKKMDQQVCYDTLFSDNCTKQEMAEVINKILDDIEISCTVRYSDGASDAKKITMGASVMTYEDAGIENPNPNDQELFIRFEMDKK